MCAVEIVNFHFQQNILLYLHVYGYQLVLRAAKNVRGCVLAKFQSGINKKAQYMYCSL